MIEVLVNEVQADGMKRVRVVSSGPLSEAMMMQYVPGAAREFARVKVEPTMALSLFYGEVVYPLREVVDVRAECAVGHARRLAVWKLMPEEGYRVSEIVEFLAQWYFEKTHQRPQFAFMKKLPKDVESGECDVAGVMLIEATWALQGCVMVGG